MIVSDHAPAVIMTGLPTPPGTAPPPTPRRTARPTPSGAGAGKGEDAAMRSGPDPNSPPDMPATPAAANERGVLCEAAIGGSEAEFRWCCARHRGRRIGGRAERKAQPLELQLRIQFCACLFSVRVHRCAISQRDGWRMFHRMRLRLGTVAKISRNFFCFGNRTLRRIILYTRLNFL